jgi:hypothetical protein
VYRRVPAATPAEVLLELAEEAGLKKRTRPPAGAFRMVENLYAAPPAATARVRES